MRAIRVRASLSSGGRPTRFARDFQRHHKRKPCWCQRTTVSGWTRTSAECQSAYTRLRKTQKIRSRRRKGSRGRWRLSTASCWRRARFSRTSWLRGNSSSRRTGQTPRISPMPVRLPRNTPCGAQSAAESGSLVSGGRSKGSQAAFVCAGWLLLRNVTRVTITPFE